MIGIGTEIATNAQGEFYYATSKWRLKTVKGTIEPDNGELVQIDMETTSVCLGIHNLIPCEYVEGIYNPKLYFVYLMKKDDNFRIGFSQTYEKKAKTVIGPKTRCMQEGGDCVFILFASTNEDEARYKETWFAVKYGIPLIPFVAREKAYAKGIVTSQKLIDKFFSEINTKENVINLCKDTNLNLEYAHHFPKSTRRHYKNIKVVLCSNGRGNNPLHRITTSWTEKEYYEKLKDKIKILIKPHKDRKTEYRIDKITKSIDTLIEDIKIINNILPSKIILEASAITPLNLCPVSNIRIGMTIPVNGKMEKVINITKLHKQPCFSVQVPNGVGYIANGIPIYNFKLS